jgi:subtilisin-like proprotein convertase family protein
MNSLSLLGTVRRKLFAAATAQTKKASPRLKVENLEDRAVPAQLPAPVIDQTSIRTIDGNGYSPTLAANPVNPNQLVSVFIRTEDDNGTENKLVFRFSNNGGSSWLTPTTNPLNLGTFNTSTGGFAPTGVDPKASDPEAPTQIPYTRVGTPSVTFDRFNNVYVVYGEYNDDNTSGRIVLRKFRFTGTGFQAVDIEPAINGTQSIKTLYRWVDSDQAYNPTVAIDNNIGHFDDTDGNGNEADQDDALAASQVDEGTVKVFVAWNTFNLNPQNSTVNNNVVRFAVSDDGGQGFGPLLYANDDGNLDDGFTRYSHPKIAFTQGRAGDPDSPGGTMVILFTNNDSRFPTVVSDTRPISGTTVPRTATLENNTAAGITDGFDPGNSAPHSAGQTIYPLGVMTGLNITSIDDISLSLNINHDSLDHVRIELVPPHVALPAGPLLGAFPAAVGFVLVGNRVNSAGTDRNFGMTGTELGRYKEAFNLDTIFKDNSSRSILDGGAASPYSGQYRPEGGNGGLGNTLLGAFAGLTSAQLNNTANGGWRLRIVDMRESAEGADPAPAIHSATLRIVQNLVDDSDPNFGQFANGQTNDFLTGAGVTPNNFEGRNYTTQPTGNPVNGVGTGLVVAVDNTLGAFSPFQNRIYMSYNAGGAVSLRYSDDGGQSWSPTTTIGAGFTPQIAVDPTTGTLGVAYYSSRFDAAGVRSAMMFASSIDGAVFGRPGTLEFNPSRPVNAVEQYFDQVRNETKDFEPITSNGLTIGAAGYGDNVGLFLFNGRVNLLHAGNWNEDGLPGTVREGEFVQLRTQNMTISAGPRVVAGEQGPILADATITELTQNGINFVNGPNTIPFNNQFDPVDGHRKFTGFVVTFDRVIDPTTFTAGDVVVRYRDPDDDASNGGVDLPTSDITIQRLDFFKDSVDGSDMGSRRFLIRVDTQSVDTIAPYRGVGTYSYAIKGSISDRIRGRNFSFNNGTPSNPFTATFSAVSNPNHTIPDAIPPLTTPKDFPVTVSGFAANQTIGNVQVRVRITHPDLSQLRLELVNPAGSVVPLVLRGDVAFDPDLLQADFGTGTGAGTAFTIFDDSAQNTISNTTDVAPYVGTYRSVVPLAQFVGGAPNGTWLLRVTDNVQNQIGQVNSFQLVITPQTVTTVPVTGNQGDQDQDGRENESNPPTPDPDGGPLRYGVQDDWFAVPNPVSRTPFQQAYASGSLPIVVTGPRLIASEPLGGTGTEDNIGLNQNVSALDLQFDRMIDAATFTKDDILRITGPLGDIPLTTGVNVQPISGFGAAGVLAPGTDSRFFRVTFTQQKLAGNYRVQLGSQIADVNGLLLDSDADAGVENLKGEAVGATLALETKTYGGQALNIAIGANQTVTVSLPVNDSYSIRRVLATISIVHPHTRNLEGRLVSPDGTKSVLLFINSPASGSDDAQTITTGTDPDLFTNITFSDALPGTPIQSGGATNGTYNPVQALSQLINTPSNGAWQLVIRNKGTDTGLIKKFELTFDKQALTNGLGEPVSDQTSAGFHIFQSNGTDATTRNNWTPVGPTGNGGTGTVGRVGAIAVDPSDPSGNTVYAAGASGGVWRTTNFLTRNPRGPNWVPLTDFGPNGAINVGALAVYPDVNGDPLKTTILVGTGSDALNQDTYDSPGSDQYNFDGVGFLMSQDAGKTWRVFDSLSNTTSFGGNQFRPINDPGRDHRFVGAVVNKIVFEPTRNSTNQLPVAYAALGRGSAAAGVEGLYRTLDGGRTWEQVSIPDPGDVTDFVLGEGSAPVNAQQQVERTVIGYLAVKGEGVYRTVGLNAATPTFTKMDFGPAGLTGVGRPTVNSGTVGTDAPTDDPMGAKGRIVLASPAFAQGNPLANNYYQSWVYAAVSEANGDFNGLYVTKDAGANWTKVRLFPRDAAEDLFTYSSLTNPGGGNHSLALAVDPLNPNVVYLGSDVIVRIDTTFLNDPYNLSLYQYSNADGGAIRPLTTGGATVDDLTLDNGINDPGELNSGLLSDDPLRSGRFPPPAPPDSTAPLSYLRELEPEVQRANRFLWNHLNLVRDPYQPFFRDTTLTVNNVLKFNNTGEDATATVVAGADHDFVSISQIVTALDPLTGKARLIFGSDNGLATFVRNDDGSGNLGLGNTANSVLGFHQPYIAANGLNAATSAPSPSPEAANRNLQVSGSRNGDIQIARFYDGDVQPSLLAANIANSLTYGVGRRLNDVSGSTENVLSTGNQQWYNPLGAPPAGPRIGTANSVKTDKQGDGLVFILRRIDDMPNISSAGYPNLDQPGQTLLPGEFRSDFFQFQQNGGVPISRTNGLFLDEADANGTDSQWSNRTRVFAVSPYNRQTNTVTHPNEYGLIMGSDRGRLYRSQDSGRNWFSVGEPGIFNDAYATALEFGAPVPNAANPRNDNDHIYVGTEEGRIWVTEKGGGLATNWKEISDGLDGSQVQKIIANPLHGSREAYAVTENGVFHIADWSSSTATWTEITTNLPNINHTAFYDGTQAWTDELLVEPATPGNTEATLYTLAIDWRPTYAAAVSKPILYVGGNGGVFRATNEGGATAWTRFPGNATDGGLASSPGGGMPVVQVTDLDLSTGEVDPFTGRQNTTGIANVLVATTLGRGTWTVSLGQQGVVAGTGPRVVSSVPVFVNAANNPFPSLDRLTIRFDKFIDPASFTLDDIKVVTPAGNTLPTSAYTLVNQAPGTDNSQWLIDFVPNLTQDGAYTITIGPNITDGPALPGGVVNLMNQDGDTVNGENPADAFKFSFTVGINDLVDYVRDTYQSLLGREPVVSNTELNATTVKNMDTSRTKALGTVAEGLMRTFNSNEARKGLVDRLFRIVGGANLEIGNLIPGYVLSAGDRDAIVARLAAGQTTPERLIVEIMTGLATSTTATTITGLGQTYYNNATVGQTGQNAARAYLRKVYEDVFRLSPTTSRLQFDWLPADVQNTQLTQVDTPQERFTFVNNLIRTAKAVKFYEGGVVTSANLKTIYAQNWIVQLAYAKYLNRTIDPVTFVQPITTTEINSGRSLLTTTPAANKLQTSERLIQKVLGSKEYFSLQTQVGGPDAGLHTNRAWVAAVFEDYVRRGTAQTVGGPATTVEVDGRSQAILDLYETQRDAFVNGVLNTAEYKNREGNYYYQLIRGRAATTSELNSWRTSLANGVKYPNLVAGIIGSSAFYNEAPTLIPGSTASLNTWARAARLRAFQFGAAETAGDPDVLALEARAKAVGRNTAALELIVNSDQFRNSVINRAFQAAFGRDASANEQAAYRAYLASSAGANRWERILRDILATGNVTVVGQTVSLPRDFWEVSK